MRTTNAKLCTAWLADHRIDDLFFFFSSSFSFFSFRLSIIYYSLYSILIRYFFFFVLFLSMICNKNWNDSIRFDIDAIPSHAPYHDTTSSTRRYFVRVNSSLFFFFLHRLRLFKCIIGLLWRERRPDQHSPVHRQSPRNIDICIYCISRPWTVLAGPLINHFFFLLYFN